MVILWIVVTIILIAPLVFFTNWILECFIISTVVVWWVLFAKYASSESKLEENILFIKFFFDRYSGLHKIAKYDAPISFLETVFPLVNIHEGGLIEFKDKSYGILIKYFPERINEEDIEGFGLKMQEVIDGLSGDTSLNFIASSKSTIKKPILDKLLESMNKKDVNPKIYEYLHSIYKMIENKNGSTIDWSFYAFFGLGKFDNLHDAVDQMDSEYPGLVDSLNDAGIPVMKIVDRVEIAREYRQMVLPVVI